MPEQQPAPEMNPSGTPKRTFDGIELAQFVVAETQRFFTDLSAKITNAIETGQIPAGGGSNSSGGYLHQLTMPQYIAFHPQHMPQVSQPQAMPVQAPQVQMMPAPMHSVGASQPGKKVKRKLSAFNVYMQKKCEQLKAAGVGQSDRFQTAAVSWKNLTQEQRQGYIHMFHANEEDPALDILPEPLPGVNNESRAERRREKLLAQQKKEAENTVTDFMSQLQEQKQAEEVEVHIDGEGEDGTESDDGKDPESKQISKKMRKS